MKKAIVLLLSLAVIGAFAFADEPATIGAPVLSGFGEVTWGANFNDMSTGFVNSAEIHLKLPIFVGGNTHGTDATTGSVTFADFSWVLGPTGAGAPFVSDADNTVGSLTAKILFPNSLYATIYSAPSFSYENAVPFAPWVNDSWGDNYSTLLAGQIVKPEWTGSTGGIALGMSGDFSASVKLASVGSYTGGAGVDGTNPNNYYGAGVDLGYVVKDLVTLNAGAFFADSVTNAIGYTVKAALAPKDSGFTATLALDGTTAGAGAMDASADIGYTMAKLVTVGASVYYSDVDLGSTVVPAYLNLRGRLDLLAVENLTASAGVDVWNTLDAARAIYIGSSLSYKMAQGGDNYVKPFANLDYATVSGSLALSAGVEAQFFPKTVFTAKYAAGSQAAANTVTSDVNAFSDDLGTVTLDCKITY